MLLIYTIKKYKKTKSAYTLYWKMQMVLLPLWT